MLAVIAVIVVIITFTSWVFYDNASEEIISQAVKSNQIVLDQLCGSFTNKVEALKDFALTVRTDEHLLGIFSKNSETYSDSEYISGYIKTMFYSREDISEIAIYPVRTAKSYSFSQINNQIKVSGGVDITSEPWYTAVSGSKNYAHTTPAQAGDSAGTTLVVYRAIIDVYTKQVIAVVRVNSNAFVLSDIDAFGRNERKSVVVLTDPEGAIYFIGGTDDAEVMQAAVQQLPNHPTTDADSYILLGQEPYMRVESSSKYSEWKLTKFLSVEELNAANTENLRMTWVTLFVSIAVSTIVIVFIIRALTSSLHAVVKQMQKAAQGDFKSTIDVVGSYEIKTLAEQYNYMVGQIDQLIDKNYLSQINEKTASLNALEAQINPHFLYNALQVISTRAVVSGNDDIYNMINALAFNLRYALKEDRIVTVEQEMEHVRNYLLILQARFGDRLCITINMNDDTRNLKIPKISIYTLVENSVQHGIEHTEGRMNAWVNIAKADDKLVVTVTDDGAGITADKLAEIQSWLCEEKGVDTLDNKHIGLRNLNARMKLLFGSEANIQIFSVPGRGTATTLEMPTTGGKADV